MNTLIRHSIKSPQWAIGISNEYFRIERDSIFINKDYARLIYKIQKIYDYVDKNERGIKIFKLYSHIMTKLSLWNIYEVFPENGLRYSEEYLKRIPSNSKEIGSPLFWFLYDLLSLKKGIRTKFLKKLKNKDIDFFIFDTEGKYHLYKIVENQVKWNNIKDEKIKGIYSILREHNYLKKLLNNTQESLSILEVYDLIWYLKKHKSNDIWGLLESYSEKEILNCFSLDDWRLFCKNKMEKYYKRIKEPIQKELALHKEGYLIKHLNSIEKLKNEGVTMKHCVGGYGYKLKHRYSIIISIRNKDEYSTMEVSKRGSLLTIEQHLGKGNTKISKERKVLGLAIVEDLYKYELDLVELDDEFSQFAYFESLLDGDFNL